MILTLGGKRSKTADASTSTPGSTIIEAAAVKKTYNTGKMEVPALRGVDFTVSRGEMVAIMGPSGCGKTTLLNCLSGLDTINDGRILIAGTDLAKMSDNARTDFRAREMGFVFQFYNLLPVLSAVENVELPLLVSGVKPKQARERALQALAQVALEKWSTQKPAELSGGQRQRVTIARALVNEPSIVWADEPTGDLDTETADDVMRVMRELNQRNSQTFVVVTHDPRIGDMCDRIIRMQDGHVINDGISAA